MEKLEKISNIRYEDDYTNEILRKKINELIEVINELTTHHYNQLNIKDYINKKSSTINQ